MASRQVADVEGSSCEGCEPDRLPLRNEAIGDSPLIEYLDRAWVQAAGAQPLDILLFAPLDNGNIHARHCQLARYHHSCRPSPGDHYRMPVHFANLSHRFERDYAARPRPCCKSPYARYPNSGERRFLELLLARRIRTTSSSPNVEPPAACEFAAAG